MDSGGVFAPGAYVRNVAAEVGVIEAVRWLAFVVAGLRRRKQFMHGGFVKVPNAVTVLRVRRRQQLYISPFSTMIARSVTWVRPGLRARCSSGLLPDC